MNKWEKLNKLYVDNGLKIFPVIKNGKTPLVTEWNKCCSNDYQQILYWMTNAKDCNWGLPCIENNLFVIDLDVHNCNGLHNFTMLCIDLGLTGEQLNTLIQTTPSGGKHLIYKSDDDLKQVAGAANAFPDYPGIDLRNSNYIVVEPSIINGKEYEFATNYEPQEMPKKLKDYILKNAEKKGKEKTPYVKPKLIYEGDRDNQVFKYLNDLYYKTKLDYDEINVLAHYFNENILDEPFDDKTIDYKVKKLFEKKRPKYIHILLPDNE